MSTNVVVNTYSHSVTYVTDKMLMSLKEIIRCSGLSPEKLTSEWSILHRGIKAWIETKDLERVTLDERAFRWALNQDAMATEKLAEGIRGFADDLESLSRFMKTLC